MKKSFNSLDAMPTSGQGAQLGGITAASAPAPELPLAGQELASGKGGLWLRVMRSSATHVIYSLYINSVTSKVSTNYKGRSTEGLVHERLTTEYL